MQTVSSRMTSRFKLHSFELNFTALQEHASRYLLGKVVARASYRQLKTDSAEFP